MRRFVSKKGKMTMEARKKKIYEVIKEMSIEEMAAVFYLNMKPILDLYQVPEEMRKELKKDVIKMLNEEV